MKLFDYNGFATELETYLEPYETALEDAGFDFYSKLVGPGMGARIVFDNPAIRLLVTNDRGQFFVSVSPPNKPETELDLSVLVSMIRLQEADSEASRSDILLDHEDYRDPLPRLFEYLDRIVANIAPHRRASTLRLTTALKRERSQLMFGPSKKRPHARAGK